MMLAFGLVLLLPLLDRTRRGLAAAGLGAAAAVLPILLVAAHNRTLDDGAFSLQANVGLNVWIGNNPSADGTPNVPQGPAYEQIIHDAWREGHLTAGEQDRYFRNKALSWAASHPLAWLALAGRKALATLSDAEFDSSMDAGIFREGLSLDVLAFVRWGWLAALAVPGGALIWRRSKDRQVWLAGLVAAALPLLVLLTSNRYRVPLLAAMVPAAAVALEAAWTERRALRAPGAQALAWLALGTGAVSHLNLLRLDGSTIFDRDRAFGASLAARGDLSAAEQRFLASRAAHPEDPHIHLLLGRLYAAAGDSASARSAVREALRMRPHYHDALVLAAMVTPAASEVQDHFRRALDADPRDPRLHGRYGEWLLASDRFADAIPPLESAVALQPRSRSFRANLALALYGAGRKSDAETHFRKILEADPDHAEALFGVAAIAFERGDRDECLRFARRAAAAGHARAAALVQRASQP
jgi:Tfp pilus assembly protein PilF